MKNLSINAQGVDSNSTHKFPWKWYLKDLQQIPQNGATVFSCFSCGGGSSMGYKLAGYHMAGNVEIDKRVMEIYRANLHPDHSFLMDVRDFAKMPNTELPQELFQLDILDGSPPCSVFSSAGDREKAWGKTKTFREGQKAQKLDDLFFHFIKIGEKLKPKIIIAETVKGLLTGNARGYVNEIFKAFDEAGYKTQLFLLDAATMGVPQKRERCFFIANRKDLDYPKLRLNFEGKPILFGQIRSKNGIEPEKGPYKDMMRMCQKSDTCIADISKRVRGRNTGFTNVVYQDHLIPWTLTSNGSDYRACDGKKPTVQDYVSIQTFPQDYNFGTQSAKYVCGMSVPPVMMAQIASQIWSQWLEPERRRAT